MEPVEPTSSRQRESTLTLALVLVVGGTILFFLNLVSLGIFFWVLVAMVGMGLVGSLHYLLWGQMMTEETAGEREEAEVRRRMEEERREYD